MRCVTLGKSIFRASNDAVKIDISPAKARIDPLPHEQWPIWAKTIARFQKQDHSGIGDTVVHLIGNERSEAFKAWFKTTIGLSCGCAERQAWLNARFPYS